VEFVWVATCDGDTAMEVTLPGTTVSWVVPEIVGSIVDVAVIVAVPTPAAVARGRTRDADPANR